MTAIRNQRKAYLASLVVLTGVTIWAGITGGLFQATAFAPAFLAICLLERKRSR